MLSHLLILNHISIYHREDVARYYQFCSLSKKKKCLLGKLEVTMFIKLMSFLNIKDIGRFRSHLSSIHNTNMEKIMGP